MKFEPTVCCLLPTMSMPLRLGSKSEQLNSIGTYEIKKKYSYQILICNSFFLIQVFGIYGISLKYLYILRESCNCKNKSPSNHN